MTVSRRANKLVRVTCQDAGGQRTEPKLPGEPSRQCSSGWNWLTGCSGGSRDCGADPTPFTTPVDCCSTNSSIGSTSMRPLAAVTVAAVRRQGFTRAVYTPLRRSQRSGVTRNSGIPGQISKSSTRFPIPSVSGILKFIYGCLYTDTA